MAEGQGKMNLFRKIDGRHEVFVHEPDRKPGIVGSVQHVLRELFSVVLLRPVDELKTSIATCPSIPNASATLNASHAATNPAAET